MTAFDLLWPLGPHGEVDERVRDEHNMREGQIFSWGFLPPGDRPGEDYNCRYGRQNTRS